MEKRKYDNWMIKCKLCDFEWETSYRKVAENPECPRCGYKICQVKKIDPEIIKKRGKIIGFVEYDPIKDEFGDVWNIEKDGKYHKL